MVVDFTLVRDLRFVGGVIAEHRRRGLARVRPGVGPDVGAGAGLDVPPVYCAGVRRTGGGMACGSPTPIDKKGFERMSNPKLGKKALRSLLAATGILMSWLRKTPWPMLKYGVMAVLIDEANRQGLKAYVHAPILKFANEALRAGGPWACDWYIERGKLADMVILDANPLVEIGNVKAIHRVVKGDLIFTPEELR